MSFFAEDSTREPYSEDDSSSAEECTCEECHATFRVPEDTEIDSCPICGVIFQ